MSERESAVVRVRDRITALISELGLRPGDRLLPESELGELFGVSRPTVREALRQLEQDGELIARQGKGRFVSAARALRVERPMTKYESMTEMLEGRGFEVTTSVLDVHLGEADPEEAQALQIELGTPVIRLLRLRFGDDRPLVVSANTVLRDSLPGPIEYRNWGESLTAALSAHGEQVHASLATISAVELPEQWQSSYGLADLGPWLLVTEVGLTREGRRVLFARDYHRGAELSFSVLRQR